MAKRKDKKIFNSLNERLSKEIEAINSIKYNQINWYDLESEVDKINSNLNKEEIEYLIYKFDEIFTFKNANVNFDDKDIIMYRVLEEILNYSYGSYPFRDLKLKEYSIDSKIDTAFSTTTDVFDLYNIAKSEVIGINNQKGLYACVDKWFENSSYKILDYEVLQKIAPIITAYIGVGCISEFNIQKLFSRISEIIEYAILPSVLHNKFLDLENEIIIVINDKEQIEISVKDRDKFKDIEIKPIKIKYVDGKKILVYENIDTKNIEEVELFKCSLETVNEEELKEFIPYNTSSHFSINDMKKEKKNSNKLEEIKLILECDSVVYEYFNMLPLSDMVIYDEEDKLKEFSKKYNYDYMPNRFYIEALDYKEKCISVIFHCLENVKILEPTELNEDILEKVDIFVNKANLKDKIGYTRQVVENMKRKWKEKKGREEQKLKSEQISKKDASNEKVEIDKTDLVKKIKNREDDPDLNF